MAIDKNMNILIVDDYKTMLRIVGNLLKQVGFTHVDEATDGGMAMEMLQKKRYGLVISDWNMMPVSGLELLKRVRAHAEARIQAVPFIMVTAESKPENLMVAKQAGVSGYLIKPFNADMLKQKLTGVLGPF